jgi:hypothetical protein
MASVEAATIRATKAPLPGYGAISFLRISQSDAKRPFEPGRLCAILHLNPLESRRSLTHLLKTNRSLGYPCMREPDREKPDALRSEFSAQSVELLSSGPNSAFGIVRFQPDRSIPPMSKSCPVQC